MSAPPAGDAAQRLAAIVDSTDDAILALDLDGTVRSWNAAAERIFGYVAADIVGQSVERLIPPERADEHVLLRGRIADGHTVRQFATERCRRDGSRVPVTLSLTPIRGATGAVTGVAAVIRDNSYRDRGERAARRLAAIVESSDDAIVSKDLNGIVTSWNAAAERMFGFPAEEMIGQSIRRIIPADRQAEEDHVLSMIRGGNRVEHFETVRQRKDGTLFPVSLTISPIVDAGGRIVGASKIARDVTDRREAEAERARLLELAQEASRLKDEFLATLSHELRTPLNAILGYVRMVKDGVLTGSKQQRALTTIERNAAALASIVDDVLDVSRIMSGKIVLNRERVDLAVLLQDAVDAVLPSAAEKNIRVDLSVDGPAWLSGDRARLQQVLWNILTNAVKFTLPGGEIVASLDRHGGEAEVTIRDTGVGIAPEFLPDIFERFSQGESGPTRERGGLGLGLSIARHLVQLHDGRIEAASAGVGQGTTMRIMLPVEAVTAARAVRTRRAVATNPSRTEPT